MDPVDRLVQEIWLESPGIGISPLHAKVEQRLGTSVPKARVKAAKALVPYRWIAVPSQDEQDEHTTTTLRHERHERHDFIVQKMQERQSLRNERRWQEADYIRKGLAGMGVVIDDILKTWTIQKTMELTLPTTPNVVANRQNDEHANGVPCQMCGHYFASRNLLFKHLRDPGTGCGNAIFASGEKLPAAPSSRQDKAAKTSLPSAPGRTARYAPAAHSVWLGDLPLGWTRPTANYKRLRALLFAQLPRSIPDPWIKNVTRKGYRSKESNNNNTREYLGFAIIVFRDEDEANEARIALDGKLVTVEGTFREWDNAGDTQQQQQQQTLSDFVLKARPVVHGDSTAAETAWSSSDEGGQDPPLMEQLRPLDLDELYRRIDQLNDDDDSCACLTENREEPADNATYLKHHQKALDKLVNLLPGERPQEHVQGRPIPDSLVQPLLDILQNLKWPARNERPRLTSQRYFVLPTNVAKDRFYGDLRQACRALMDWADADYYYSGIAVTKNFVASPHIDVKDQTFQYAVALGDFCGGGQLCVESSSSPGTVKVIDTKHRIARLDGRHVHWVRTWDQGDRFSLIFYDTRERVETAKEPFVSAGEQSNC